MTQARWPRAAKLYALVAGIWTAAAVVGLWSYVLKGNGLFQSIVWSALAVAMGALAVGHRGRSNEETP
jgi:hypothetical protein